MHDENLYLIWLLNLILQRPDKGLISLCQSIVNVSVISIHPLVIIYCILLILWMMPWHLSFIRTNCNHFGDTETFHLAPLSGHWPPALFPCLHLSNSLKLLLQTLLLTKHLREETIYQTSFNFNNIWHWLNFNHWASSSVTYYII